jgi:integrase
LVGLAGLLPPFLPPIFMHIEERGKSLRICWRFEGEKYHKTLTKHNNPIGRKNAESVMASIEKDILSGHFDPAPYTKQGKAKKQNIDITASELFAKYAAHRLENWELSYSSKVRFKGISSKLTQFLGAKPAGKVTTDIAANVIAAWSEQASSRTIGAYLFDLAAAWDWAQKEDVYTLGASNPWNKSLDRLRRKKLPAPKKLKPFTIAELKAIAQGFRNHPKHSYYTDAAIFISQTA